MLVRSASNEPVCLFRLDFWWPGRLFTSGSHQGRSGIKRREVDRAAAIRAPDRGLSAQFLTQPFEGAGPSSHLRFVQVLSLAQPFAQDVQPRHLALA
jgi:hypothetical protein